MKEFGNGIIAIVMGIITVAIIAVIVSPKASTSNVITAAGNFLSKIIGAAVNPVS